MGFQNQKRGSSLYSLSCPTFVNTLLRYCLNSIMWCNLATAPHSPSRAHTGGLGNHWDQPLILVLWAGVLREPPRPYTVLLSSLLNVAFSVYSPTRCTAEHQNIQYRPQKATRRIKTRSHMAYLRKRQLENSIISQYNFYAGSLFWKFRGKTGFIYMILVWNVSTQRLKLKTWWAILYKEL